MRYMCLPTEALTAVFGDRSFLMQAPSFAFGTVNQRHFDHPILIQTTAENVLVLIHIASEHFLHF